MLGDVILIVVLFLAAMALVVLEICTPFFGLISVLALVCLTAADYLCFQLSQLTGIIAIVATVVAFPVFVIWAVRTIPKTPLGRRLALKREPVAPGEGTPQADRLRQLVGKEGVAETLLRPGGMILLDGQRVDAAAESGLIEQGSRVRVLRITGSSLVVRKVEE
jgi:membrane-bound serine protease (ClpP class)